MSESAIGSEHHLVIGRLGGAGHAPAVLLLKGPEGWSLPSVQSEERRSADVADLNRAVRSEFGVEVSILRCLSDEPAQGGRPRQQVYEVETHGTDWAPPSHARWIGDGELGGVALARPEQRTLLDSWFLDRAARRPPSDGRDWMSPGWQERVIAWVDGELSRGGLGSVREIEQVRVWEFSHVLRLRTADGGVFYLKALPHSGAKEPDLTRRLAELHPRSMPALIAVEPDRRLMLMRATHGAELMEVSDPCRWEQAAETFAHIQIAWIKRREELTALGCPHRGLDWLVAEIDPLLADTPALIPEHAEGLSDSEVVKLRRRAPELEAMCGELAGYAIPDSLEHGDLWGANVIAGGDACVFIDWEDASLSHPFFSPSLLLLSLDYTEALAHVPDARARIREAYLRPWRAVASTKVDYLEPAFDVAQRVAMLHYAVQFRRFALPRIETSWEVKAFAPLFLKRLIEHE